MRKDLSTKIISLLFAIFLWFYIIQVQNPEIQKNIRDIPVQFTKTELEERGLTLINDKEAQINVKIKGQRKYISSIKKEDITIVADVTGIDSIGTHTINTDVILPYGNIELLEQTPQQITVTVDKVVVAEKEIKLQQIGKPKNSYCISDYEINPKKMKIKGPKSIVSTIEALVAEVDVDGKDEDVTVANAPLKFIGTSGESFNSPYVTLQQQTVGVHCTISKEKTVDIDVKFADGVNNANEYYVLDDSSVKTVEIVGATDAIETIQKIPTHKITRGMISASGEVEVGIDIPAGVISKDGKTVKIKLKKVVVS